MEKCNRNIIHIANANIVGIGLANFPSEHIQVHSVGSLSDQARPKLGLYNFKWTQLVTQVWSKSGL